MEPATLTAEIVLTLGLWSELEWRERYITKLRNTFF